jgi:hypothetical protein
MVALALLLEKLDRHIPWAPWVIGGGLRAARPRRDRSVR